MKDLSVKIPEFSRSPRPLIIHEDESPVSRLILLQSIQSQEPEEHNEPNPILKDLQAFED
jgi:hypothetical protein